MNPRPLSAVALSQLRRALLLLACGFVLWLLWPFAIVPPGHRGVLTTLGKPSEQVYGEGIHLRIPLVQALHTMDVRVARSEGEGEAASKDLQAVRVGHAVTAEFDAYPGERWSGRISWIAPVSSPETRTTRVRVVVANERLRLKPGMAATLTIVGAAAGATPVLVVPRTAVLVTGERALVFVKRGDGQLEPRQVTLGATTHELIEILGGVALGDTVVASATFLVDAESNLGTALGGMGDMPGMEITVPPRAGPTANPPAAPPRKER